MSVYKDRKEWNKWNKLADDSARLIEELGDFDDDTAIVRADREIKVLLSKNQDLERQLEEAREDVKSYKYDLNTLVDIISDCVNKMSMEECYDTLKEVVDHYEKQKEQEPQPNLGGLVDEHCDLIEESEG